MSFIEKYALFIKLISILGGIANGATAMPSGVQAVEGTLANTKEKTPMCLINELARYNKVDVMRHSFTCCWLYLML